MRLSIITPTLNIARWLPETLDSVRSQARDADFVEHIVVDGGSEDGSDRIATEHGAKVISVDRPGIYRQLNEGMRVATGDIIGYLGGDDLLLPGAVREVGHWAKRGRNPIFVGGIRWTDMDGRSRGDLAAPPRWMNSAAFASLGWNCMQHTSAFVRKPFMQELGGFDEAFQYNGDYEFFARALNRAAFDRTPRSLSAWRMSAVEPSDEKRAGMEDETRSIQQTFAPESEMRRKVYQTLLKVWLNSSSPRWLFGKRFQPRRTSPSEADARATDPQTVAEESPHG
jgi:glycosyltransferase involved in cell wall biosynthesis